MDDKIIDMALEALIAASHEVSDSLSIDLIKAIYSIEKTSQFDDSRDTLSAIQKLIEDEVKINSWGDQ